MVDFEIDIKKVSWIPKHVEEIAEVASKAFECPMTFQELQDTAYGVIGTDHIEKVQIEQDEDIPKFVAIKTKTRFEEKVIKFRLPERAVRPEFQPKKTKVLVKGKPCGKFFGECEVSTRTVEFSIKLFDCGHFYMKQTLPGSGASPYWVIFEGTWQPTDRGLAFEYLFRYSWQVAKTRLMPDFALEAVPKNHRSRLAWCGEIPEQQLNGSVPAIVGEEAFCWIEVCREPDVVEKGKARFNESGEGRAEGNLQGLNPKLRVEKAPRETADTVNSNDDIKPSETKAEETTGTSTARRRGAPAATGGAPSGAAKTDGAGSQGESSTDEEPMWPLYALLGIFLLILLFFCRSAWLDKTQAVR